jgi:putative salt-induced outer membrane protein
MNRSLIALAGGAVVLAAGTALAEDTVDRSWKGEVEFAWLVKRGNTESETFIGKTNAEKDGVRWRHTGKLEATNEEKTDTLGVTSRSAERYFASYKLDRKLGDDAPGYLFNIVTYDKDLFSGFHYQASYALGLGRRWLANDRHTLDTEAGPGYRVVCLEPETSYGNCQNTEEGGILRLGLKYDWKISDTAQFRESITSEISDDITTTRAETSLTSRINGRLAMRISHLLKHTSEVTAPAKKTDNELTVSLVYSF